MTAEIFVDNFVLIVFAMLFLYFFVGIFKRRFFIGYPKLALSADYEKHSRKGFSAVFMNVLLVIGVLFAFHGFIYATGVTYSKIEVIISLMISVSIFYLLEKSKHNARARS